MSLSTVDICHDFRVNPMVKIVHIDECITADLGLAFNSLHVVHIICSSENQ